MSGGRRGGGSGWANGLSPHDGPKRHGLERTLNIGLGIWADGAVRTPARAQPQQKARLSRGSARAQWLGRCPVSGGRRRVLTAVAAGCSPFTMQSPPRSPAPANVASALTRPWAAGSPPTGVKADSRRSPEPRRLPTPHTMAEGTTSLPSGVRPSSPALCPATASSLSRSWRKCDPLREASECPAYGPGVNPPTAAAQRARVSGSRGAGARG